MTEKWEKDRAKFEEELPCRFLSLTCLIIGTIHFGISDWKADWVLFAFVVLGFAPWLGHVFDSIGGEKWGAKYRKIEQGETSVQATPLVIPQPQPAIEVPLPAVQAPGVVEQMPKLLPEQFTYDAMKVLATLWRYQKIHFKNSREQRWTFTVGPGSPEHTEFSRGFVHLVSKGFANLAPNNGQVMLTDAGYDFCLAHDANINKWSDIYDRFSN
jgi:hypothetical protein